MFVNFKKISRASKSVRLTAICLSAILQMLSISCLAAWGDSYSLSSKLASHATVTGNKYVLKENVEIRGGSEEILTVDGEMVVDLNGYRLERAAQAQQYWGWRLSIGRGGHLTVIDSKCENWLESAQHIASEKWYKPSSYFWVEMLSIAEGGKLTVGQGCCFYLPNYGDTMDEGRIGQIDGELELDEGVFVFEDCSWMRVDVDLTVTFGPNGRVVVATMGALCGGLAWRFEQNGGVEDYFAGISCQKLADREFDQWGYFENTDYPVYVLGLKEEEVEFSTSETTLRIDFSPSPRTITSDDDLLPFAHSKTGWSAGSAAQATITYQINEGEPQMLGRYADGDVATWSPTKNGTYVFTHAPGNLTATFAVQKPAVSLLTAQQRYPWNNILDYTYMVSNLRPKVSYKLGIDLTMNGVTKSVTNELTTVADGTYNGTINLADHFSDGTKDPAGKMDLTLVETK